MNNPKLQDPFIGEYLFRDWMWTDYQKRRSYQFKLSSRYNNE